MYKIIFDNGEIELLVATEMETKKECKALISLQEKPECYYIEKM